ncbi:uncharacterized protein BO97DRAFT_461285 [Aspergillus homomorphus CBS 101889]|uniref:Uncharacterized protein n=1 Tax=Aspergillus homomorphus (strain CBS 101889) TaxID=1450537 RepID=A0A395I6U2_ASPHC|nr:hypothetical protein BO97DRAFT_461285 [Aspergillus homomorphus CBS 101889]RAL15586.1 hypothetical protein BO97DRAFT_461285 [Aspergillus homomorphus CBS 101889]
MSVAYPEEECFFKRSTLTTSTSNAEKPEHFCSHMMLEYIWNRPAFVGPDSLGKFDLHHHPRAAYKAPYNDRYRQAMHDLCVSGNRFRDQEKGGSLESWVMMMPMPQLAKREDWLLIDRTACIRAIDIPVAQQTSEDYSELCTFLQVNFAIKRDASIMTHPEIWSVDARDYLVGDDEQTFPLDPTMGLLPDGRWTLAINIHRLVNLLSRRFDSTMRSIIPVADLALMVSEEVQKSAKEQRAYLSEGWIGGSGGLFGFAFSATQSDTRSISETTTQPPTQLATTTKAEPVKAASPEVLKKYESIRKVRYWSLLKPASAPAPAPAPIKTKSQPPKEDAPPSIEIVKEVPVAPDVPLKAPPKLSLEELKPSASFQPATQALLNSGDASATTGNEDDVAGEVLEENSQEASDQPEESSANFYDWLTDYLGDELWFEEEDEGEEEEEI